MSGVELEVTCFEADGAGTSGANLTPAGVSFWLGDAFLVLAARCAALGSTIRTAWLVLCRFGKTKVDILDRCLGSYDQGKRAD